MQKFTNELFSSDRLKSLLWRTGAVMVVAGLNYLSANLGQLNFSSEVVVFAGLILGEVTKAINNTINK